MSLISSIIGIFLYHPLLVGAYISAIIAIFSIFINLILSPACIAGVTLKDLCNLQKIVINEMQCNSVAMISNFLTESIGKPGKPPFYKTRDSLSVRKIREKLKSEDMHYSKSVIAEWVKNCPSSEKSKENVDTGQETQKNRKNDLK